MSKTHIMSDETGRDIAASLRALAGKSALEWDADSGAYTNESIAALLSRRADGLVYGVSVPKGSAVACTKTGANSGIAAPAPGIVGRAAQDPYIGLGAFFSMEVNGTIDADGTPHVTAISGDGRFARDGSNGNVWILAPVLWWRIDETGANSVEISVSDSKQSGLEAQPGARMPSGGLRPYMLYAKYALVKDASGNPASITGKQVWNRSVSHNSLISQCKTATTGYAGKSYADDWYVKVMFLLKYATKNSQSVFSGCTNYSAGYAPALAESGVTRVVLTKAQASAFTVGSSVMLGTAGATGKAVDRGAANAYDVFDARKIIRIEAVNDANSAVYVDGAAFDTLTTMWFQTAPWATGACDGVEGDGSPSNPTNGREPFTVQGIELGLGMYEVLGDVMLKSDGTTGWKVFVNKDSRNEASTVSAKYTDTGKVLPSGDADASHYTLYPSLAGGLLLGQGDGASTTTGLCDQTYTNKTATTGEREFLSLGSLWNGSLAGLWYVNGVNGTGNAGWNIGSRLSANGRKG